jgi:hypothetical protein
VAKSFDHAADQAVKDSAHVVIELAKASTHAALDEVKQLFKKI